MPVSSSTSVVTSTIQKKNFCPALYLPTSESSRSAKRRYSMTLKLLSPASKRICEIQSTTITSVAAENATPSHACSQRQTERPPKKVAIQPKTGDQMGMPLKMAPKKSTATVQCTTREESLCRTSSLPTTTSSRSRPTCMAV